MMINPVSKTNNILIAAFTTAYAWFELYSYLEQLQTCALRGQRGTRTPLILGDLMDEVGGDTIQEFIVAEPKSYGYQTNHQK